MAAISSRHSACFATPNSAGSSCSSARPRSTNFNAFFDLLGPGYAALRAKHNIYNIFRCGLAHEYYVKQRCSIVMLSRSAGPGIRVYTRGHFTFVVERYNRDLNVAFDGLGRKLFKS